MAKGAVSRRRPFPMIFDKLNFAEVVRLEVGGDQFPARVLDEDLYLAFGRREAFTALARKLNAVLEQTQAFLQREVAVLKLHNDHFELIQ